MIEILNRYTKAVLYSSATAKTILAALVEAHNNGANLSGADLSEANLYSANLSGANLPRANLYSANLSGADLSGTKQKVLQIQGSRHQITAIDSEVRIGCHVKLLAEWLKHYKAIGKAEGYSESQIEEYGLHLNHIRTVLEVKP